MLNDEVQKRAKLANLVKARKMAALGMTLVEASPYKNEIDRLIKDGKSAFAIAKELHRKYPNEEAPKSASIRNYIRKRSAGDIIKSGAPTKHTKELANKVNRTLKEALDEVQIYLQEVRRWRMRTRLGADKEKQIGIALDSRNQAIRTYVDSVKELMIVLKGFGLLWEQDSGKVTEEEVTIGVADFKDELAALVKMAKRTRTNVRIPSQGIDETASVSQPS